MDCEKGCDSEEDSDYGDAEHGNVTENESENENKYDHEADQA